MDTEINFFEVYITTHFNSLAYFNFDNFDLQEIMFFQFLVVYCQNGEFFHSEKQIKERLGIGKDKLKQIVWKFQDYGILIREVRKDPLTRTYYELDFIEILRKDFIYELYNSNADYEKIEVIYDKLAGKQERRELLLREKQRNDGKNTSKNITDYTQELQHIFKERREKYNKRHDCRKKLPYTGISVSKSDKTNFIKALEKYNFEDIKNAFIGYCDDLNKYVADDPNTGLTERPKNILGYFLMNTSNEFSKIHNYLNSFGTDYTIT
jgi:hypothetical protein